MIPQVVYNHIKFSNGGDVTGPCARMGDYELRQSLDYYWRPYVSATFKWKMIKLSDIPASKEKDWDILA